MGTPSGLLKAARADLGMSGRPNRITRAYADDHGTVYLKAAWCNMAVTYWARKSDNARAVLPGGDRAYTVSHAQDFKKADRWYAGTATNVNRAKPGDIVFFDWGGTDGIGYIDHVGVVEVALGGGRVQTIEGNTGDAVKRRVRSYTVIAGLGSPAFSGGSWMEEVVKDLPMLREGAEGEHVQTLRALLLARSHPEIGGVAGKFDKKVTAAVRAVQRWGDVEDDGVVGPKTWPVLLRVH